MAPAGDVLSGYTGSSADVKSMLSNSFVRAAMELPVSQGLAEFSVRRLVNVVSQLPSHMIMRYK